MCILFKLSLTLWHNLTALYARCSPGLMQRPSTAMRSMLQTELARINADINPGKYGIEHRARCGRGSLH